jgi:hypothetical protein
MTAPSPPSGPAWSTGLSDPPAGAPLETWTTGEAHAYRIEARLRDDNGAQGLTATPAFTWEARNRTCGQITPTWLTGLEGGAVGSAMGTTGTLTAETGTVRSGSYALRADKVNGGQSYGSVTLPATNRTLAARFALRLPALPSGTPLVFAADVSGGNQLQVAVDGGTGRLRAGFQGALQSSSVVLVPDRWYLVSLLADSSVSPRTVDWWLDGTAQTRSSIAVAPNNMYGFRFGSNVLADQYTALFDDMVVSTSIGAPIGDGRVVRLAPNGMGTSNDPSSRLQHEDGGALGAATWQRLDEVPATSTADSVRQTAIDPAAYAEVTFADTQEDCVNGVRAVIATHASGMSANVTSTGVLDGGAETVFHNGTISSGAPIGYAGGVIAPAAGRWDTAAVNGLRGRPGRVSAMGSVPYWDAFYLEADIGLS